MSQASSNAIAEVVLLGWLPIVLGLFAVLRARRAVIWAFLLAWLFLPMAGYKLEGLPDYTKMSATCVGVLIGAALFDTARLVSFRLRWIDLPMLVWCLCPMASSLSNGLGWYDGLSGIISQTVAWGLPYFIGRMYFRNLADLRELAVALFFGGLIYVPLCLFEIRMSPQLHTMVYGYHQHSFAQTYRFGGYRPTVFMQHGLMVGMWMCMTALMGVLLWQAKALPRSIARVPIGWGVASLVLTAILCKSAGALALMVGGIGVWALVRYAGLSSVVWALTLVAPIYAATRISGVWDGAEVVSLSRDLFGPERAQSLQFRLDHEGMLIDRAMQRPIFGWGGWGRNRVHDEYGRDMSVTDGLWVIALGTTGLVGLASLTLAMLLPAGLVLLRLKTNDWARPGTAACAALGLVVVLYWIDCIPNAMGNPIFTLVAGGLGSLALMTTGRASSAAVAEASRRRSVVVAGAARG